MTAAEVDPLHLRDELAEPDLEGGERALERIRVDVAKRVEVQTLEPVEIRGAHVRAGGSEPRARTRGIVERDLDLLMLVIDPQATRDVARLVRALDRRAVLAPLRGRVE